MTDVALKLLETGKSNPEQLTNAGLSALFWTNKNNLPAYFKERLLEEIEKSKNK